MRFDRIIPHLFALSLMPAVYAFAANSTHDLTLSIDSAIQRIENKTSLKIYYKDLPEAIAKTAVYQLASKKDHPELSQYLQLFEEEIRKYPKSFFRNSRLQGIVIAKNLFHQKKPAEGLYQHKEKLMFFDFSRGMRNPKRQRHSIHHELYHMIEMQSIGYPGWKDSEWANLNEEGFMYGQNRTWQEIKNVRNYSAPPRPGFITDYAMTSIEEDKAEVYAALLIESQNTLMHAWAQEDPILRKKLELMKEFIRYFCKEMDKNYWKNLFGSNQARREAKE
ncbi:MAG: putative zinc-binding metallopeptidase [Candidatus Omnitrophota bacterium]